MSSLFDIENKSVGSVQLNKLSWIEDNFFSTQTPGEREERKNYLGVSICKKNISIFFIITGIALSIILAKVFYLQVIKGESYRAMAEDNRVREVPIIAQRGIIFDRFGKQLVENVPSFSLVLVPKDLPKDRVEREPLLNKIAAISKIDQKDIDALLNKHGSYNPTTSRWQDKTFGYFSLILKENLDYETALKIETQSADMPGIRIDSGDKRNYPSESNASSTLSLSHILGYVGRVNEKDYETLKSEGYLNSDIIGRSGLENTYEKDLRGAYGAKKVEVDVIGKEQSVLEIQEPTPGKNLVLSIDVEAQAELQKDLQSQLDKIGKKRGSAIAINPQNGEIIALVSLPAFNNNDFSGGIKTDVYKKYIEDSDRPLFNRAIAGNFPSGSTIKPVMAAAALQEKIITEDTTVLSVGGFKVGGVMFKDWKAGGHGITNVEKSLANSINTFYYYIGGGYGNFVGLGVDRIAKYLRKFGLGQKTGIDLPGEAEGLVPDPAWKNSKLGESWYIGDTYNLSIGQGFLLVTPLQVAVWTEAVANGGKIFTPQIVHKIVNPVDKTENVVSASPSKSVDISEDNINIARKGMLACVQYGSCQSLKLLPFSTGAKTGTAQWNNNSLSHGWFTAFAPYENPQIVVTAMIEEGGEGGIVTMPVARNFLSWWGKKYLPKNAP